MNKDFYKISFVVFVMFATWIGLVFYIMTLGNDQPTESKFDLVGSMNSHAENVYQLCILERDFDVCSKEYKSNIEMIRREYGAQPLL